MHPTKSTDNSSVLLHRMIYMLGVAALALCANANAGCSPYEPPKPTADLERLSDVGGGRFMEAVFEESAGSESQSSTPYNPYAVVGLWKVKLVSKGSKGIPDGAPIDFGYQTWHSDGTEILNSGMRPPSTSSFCMGVWRRVGYHHYSLNHVTLSWDSTGTVFVGPGNILEDIVVDQSRNKFAGTFKIIQYATDEKTVLADITGEVTGERISPR